MKVRFLGCIFIGCIAASVGETGAAYILFGLAVLLSGKEQG